MVLTVSSVISPVTGLFATVLGGITPAKLTPASGRQDHTTSPSAETPFVKSAAASTASRHNVRDDRETPLCLGRDEANCEAICLKEEPDYF